MTLSSSSADRYISLNVKLRIVPRPRRPGDATVMKQDFTRRDFVTSAAAAMTAAPAVLPAQTSPNNRVRVGWIATGSRGKHVMNQMYLKSKDSVDVVAVCDAYQGNLNAGADIVASQE